MAVDQMSRRALLEAKKGSDFAPRHKFWPPKDYTAPTAEEFDALRRDIVATRHRLAAKWAKIPDDVVIRRVQLLELVSPSLRGREASEAYDYARTLRGELNRRGLVHQSISLHRCEGCSHGTERLFEATQETHPGMVNRSGTEVASAWFCARCWSGDDADDEDETEGEG